ncbi:hypothetical protein GN156_03905 [bacterium LRH843]|nr:hypothetical protein [bacterium LRH843]
MKNFEITSLKLGEYELPVPYGLSELINSAQAWGLPKKRNPHYERKIVKREGQYITILTLKKETKP